MYFKEFDIRWSDLDANKHLGNSTYIDYMSNTRMAFFEEQGMGLDYMTKLGIGPIALYEHIYYFKEILLGLPIQVSLEVLGYSEDYRFVQFVHNFYNTRGENLAYSEMLFSCIDIKSRKLATLPEEIKSKIKSFPKAKTFKILTKEDTRRFIKKPINLN